MTKRKWIIFGITLIAFVVVFWAVTARHETPPGQPPLADVTQQTLSQVRQEFNASLDSDRVVLLLSPTCPVCVQGSSVVNDVLGRHPGDKVRVIVIWEPMLPTDWNKPTSAVLARLSDKRAIQWWDKQHIIAGLLKTSSANENPGCCKRNETLWDVIAVYPPGVKWTESLPAPGFFAGPVVRGAPKWEAQLKQHYKPRASNTRRQIHQGNARGRTACDHTDRAGHQDAETSVAEIRDLGKSQEERPRALIVEDVIETQVDFVDRPCRGNLSPRSYTLDSERRIIEFAIRSCYMRVVGKTGIWVKPSRPPIMYVSSADRAGVRTISICPPNILGLDKQLF